MSGNGASAKGIRQVGYFDCAGGGQVVVDGRVAFIAHMKAPHGTTIVDVSDPSKPPRQLAAIEVPAGTHSHKVRAANGLMLVNREAPRRPAVVAESRRAGSASTTCRHRAGRARSRSGGRGGTGVHRFTFDGRYAYISPEMDGYVGNIMHDPRPGRPEPASGSRPLVDAGAVDRRRRDADVVGTAAPLPSPDPRRQPALRQLLARRLRHPRHRGHGEAALRLRARLEPAVPDADAHGAARAVPAPRPRASCSSPTRTWPSSQPGPPSFLWLVDITDEKKPDAVRQLPGGRRDGTAPARVDRAAISRCETITSTEIPVAWFAHGLRIVDIAEPARAARGRALPAAGAGGLDARVQQRRVRGRPRADVPRRPRARRAHPRARVMADSLPTRAAKTSTNGTTSSCCAPTWPTTRRCAAA